MGRAHRVGLIFGVLGAGLLGACGKHDGQVCTLFSEECEQVAPPVPNQPPTGSLSVQPATTIEGAPVVFTVAITDPEGDTPLTCALDPEGDGSFQLPVGCTGTAQFTYQSTGAFAATVRAIDAEDAVTTVSTTVTITDAPAGIAVSEVRLLQAYRVPLTGAEVCVYQVPLTSCAFEPGTTDGNGVIAIAIPAGTYKMVIRRDTTITLDVEVDTDNASARLTMITPFDCSQGACTNVSAEATFATLQGVVRSLADNSPIANAQVSISGGNATGGPYSTAFTDASGEYTLTINVGGDATLIQALTNSTLRLLAPGFAEINSQFSVTPRHFAGLNFFLDPNAPAPVVLFRETFETTSTTAAGWAVEGGDGGQTFWQLHTAGAGIVNTLVPQYVSLAPNDTSGAALPDPAEGSRAYWYGGATTGSFVGTQINGDVALSGGTSEDPHDGRLTSPPINLSGVSGPVRLTFKTFWEIESVNPNNSGFDLLNVYMAGNDGVFTLVGRLNPLSDPAGGGNRAPLPYSSIGFNAAPLWVQTETIALPGAAGNSLLRLRFEFDTRDGLYNGFRGWLIDDIVIEPGQGSLTAP